MRDFFGKLHGNSATKARLGRAVLDKKMPHALLIDGAPGSGKLTLAYEIAAALNCEHKSDEGYPLPCHECNTCKRILGGGFTDLRVLLRDESRATIGVEAVKDLRREMFLSPTESEYKIYVICDAERMTPEAQNALLIVLEEPPKNVLIMLLAAGTDRILTTIKSRAQYIATERFSPEEISEYLLAVSPEAVATRAADPEGYREAIAGADGRIGLAASLISPERREALKEERAETVAVLLSLGRGRSFAELYSAVMALPSKRGELAVSLERLISAVGDLIKVKHGGSGDFSFFSDRGDAERIAEGISERKLFKLYDILSSAYADNTKNANINALISTLAARMRTA